MSSGTIAKGTKHRYFNRISATTPSPSTYEDEPSQYLSRPSTVDNRRKSTALSRRTEDYDDDASQHPNYVPVDPHPDDDDVYEDPVIDPDPEDHDHNYGDDDHKHMCIACVAKRLRRKKARDSTCVSCAAERFRTYRRNDRDAQHTKKRSKSLDAHRPLTPTESVVDKKSGKKNKHKKMNVPEAQQKTGGKKMNISDAKRRMANNKDGPPIWHNVGDPTQRVYTKNWENDFIGDHAF